MSRLSPGITLPLAVLPVLCGIVTQLAAQESPTQGHLAQAAALTAERGGASSETDHPPGKPSPAADAASVPSPALGPTPMSLDFAVNGSDGSQGVFTFRIGLSRAAESREELRQRYNELERASRELAGRLRASLADPASREGLRKRLRETVEQAFIARQSLQRAELAEFAKRLQGIQQSIETRETFRQQIVDRRVEELLGEQLKWDSDTAIPAPAQSTATSPPASPYSAPLGGPFVPGGVVPLRPGTNFRVEKMTDDNLFWTALGARLAVARQEEIGTDRYRGGLRITAVRAGGPAEKAGLHVGDILVGVGNWETLSLEHLNFIFQETAARTAVQLHAIRQGPYGATRVSEMFQWELPNSAP